MRIDTDYIRLSALLSVVLKATPKKMGGFFWFL